MIAREASAFCTGVFSLILYCGAAQFAYRGCNNGCFGRGCGHRGLRWFGFGCSRRRRGLATVASLPRELGRRRKRPLIPAGRISARFRHHIRNPGDSAAVAAANASRTCDAALPRSAHISLFRTRASGPARTISHWSTVTSEQCGLLPGRPRPSFAIRCPPVEPHAHR